MNGQHQLRLSQNEKRKVRTLSELELVLPKMVVLTGMSGGGKGTIGALLKKAWFPHYPEMRLVQPVSLTSRPQRPGEQDGDQYHFVGSEQIIAARLAGQLVTDVTVGDHCYGYTVEAIETVLADPHAVAILDVKIDVLSHVLERYPDAKTVFIMAPDDATLRKRLRERDGSTEEEVAFRASLAPGELAMAWRLGVPVVVNRKILTTAAEVVEALNLPQPVWDKRK